MKILVTGSTGFVGRHVIQWLVMDISVKNAEHPQVDDNFFGLDVAMYLE